MAKLNIRKGDKVKVIAGKDKGAESVVMRVIPERQRVVVEKVNVVKKAMRPTQANPQGGLQHKGAPIHVSNVALICPKCSKPTRAAHKILGDGKKVRVCKKCGAEI